MRISAWILFDPEIAKELEDTKEDFKTQRLINMEMKDYERSVNELKKLVESAQEEAEATKKG